MDKNAALARACRPLLLLSLIAGLMPFALLWLPGGHWRSPLVAAAATLSALLMLAMVLLPWRRLPASAPSLVAFGYLLVYALLRVAGGVSGVAPIILLPVFWIALGGSRRQLACMFAAIILAFLVPPLLGRVHYSADQWRAAILLLASAGVIGATIRALVRNVLDRERERDRLLEELDSLAHRDALTGLPNRRAWEAGLARELARERRSGEGIVLARLLAHVPSPHRCSAGVASWDHTESGAALLARADAALYGSRARRIGAMRAADVA